MSTSHQASAKIGQEIHTLTRPWLPGFVTAHVHHEGSAGTR